MTKKNALKDLKEVFDSLADNGVIGDPIGKAGYGYLRVSTEEQAAEGRSGLTRQLRAIAARAAASGWAITWDRLLSDESSGFSFEDRASLQKLLKQDALPVPLQGLVIESLDRLSRNADWHQGFLIERFSKMNVELKFYQEFNSRIERQVLGAISQDGMERQKAMMQQGLIDKARSGRITAKRAAYGYQLVDRHGLVGPTVKKDTHYAILEEEAVHVRFMFENVAGQLSLNKVAAALRSRGIVTRSEAPFDIASLRFIVRNPVYKGQYISKAIRVTKEWDEARQKRVERRTRRPVEEQIIVPVPAIVTSELWSAANARLDKNREQSSRRTKSQYLLNGGIMKCATCGRTIYANGGSQLYRKAFYACQSDIQKWRGHWCGQPHVSARVIETAVWNAIVAIVTRPDLLEAAFTARMKDKDSRADQQARISDLEKKLVAHSVKEDRLHQAYLAEAYTVEEYKRYRAELAEARITLQDALNEAQLQLDVSEDMLAKQRSIKALAKVLSGKDLTQLSFEAKKKVIRSICDRIEVDINARTFTIFGALNIDGSFENGIQHEGQNNAGSGQSENSDGSDTEVLNVNQTSSTPVRITAKPQSSQVKFEVDANFDGQITSVKVVA